MTGLQRLRNQDIKLGKQEGIKLGEQRGIKLGEQRGIKLGEHKGMVKVAKNLLRQGVVMSVIQASTGLSTEQLNRLKDEIKG